MANPQVNAVSVFQLLRVFAALLFGVLVASRWMIRAGGTPVQVPWLATAGILTASVTLLYLAWPMREYSARAKRRSQGAGAVPADLDREGTLPRLPLAALDAARTLYLAQASAMVGAGMAGGFLAFTLIWLSKDVPWAATQVFSPLAAAVACTQLVGAGMLVQHWCRVPPESGKRG